MSKKYYLKKRVNPQTGTYYVACGQLSEASARRKEGSLYGKNYMLGFDTEAEYNARIVKLRELGVSVQ